MNLNTHIQFGAFLWYWYRPAINQCVFMCVCVWGRKKIQMGGEKFLKKMKFSLHFFLLCFASLLLPSKYGNKWNRIISFTVQNSEIHTLKLTRSQTHSTICEWFFFLSFSCASLKKQKRMERNTYPSYAHSSLHTLNSNVYCVSTFYTCLHQLGCVFGPKVIWRVRVKEMKREDESKDWAAGNA